MHQQMKLNRRVVISFYLAITVGLLSPNVPRSSASEPCTLDQATATTIDSQPFLSNGYNVRWNLATNRIAFMSPGADGYYRVFTERPDGTDRFAITMNSKGLPAKHQGMVYWHPSGRYLMFIAQKEEWHGKTMFGIPDYGALPGFGVHDDIWLITAYGSRSWPLTNEPNMPEEGELLPVFSPDGKHVAWACRQPDKKYKINVADFVEAPTPHLGRIREYEPGGAAYYETGSFTSDSRSLMYTSDQDTHSFWRSQIYRLDLDTGKGVRLTTGNEYNEHPTVVKTPTGDWVVFMSDKQVDRYAGHLMLGTDWWAMRIDGSGVKRLTTMSVNRKDNAENARGLAVGCTVAISPTGDYMLGDVQDSLVKQTGLVRIVRFFRN
jgi:Tol biopolymer transport system component